MKRTLGHIDDTLNPIGLGCMGLSEFYGKPTDEGEAIKLLHEAIELGVNHFDTAELYGPLTNEALLGKAFADRRDAVFVATKFGPLRDPETGQAVGIDGSAANCRRAVEGSLKRLQTETIDLYYLHRMDPKIPIEDTVGAMADLVKEGKIRGIGLSEAGADTIRRAAKVHPISAIQSEYSIFTRDLEAGIIPAIKEAGASLVAYSPLGRGMLTGAFSESKKPTGDDYRATSIPRFEGEAYAANLALVEKIKEIAGAKDVTPAQLSLAWLLAQGDFVHTIPGTTKLANLENNLGALSVTLSEADMAELDILANHVKGERYNERGMAIVEK